MTTIILIPRLGFSDAAEKEKAPGRVSRGFDWLVKNDQSAQNAGNPV
jgi:hypothetical protein